MNRLHLLLLSCCLSFYGAVHAQEDVYDVILTRITTDLQGQGNDGRLSTSVSRDLKNMVPRGYWLDVHYDNPEFEHLARVKAFAGAYSRKGGLLYGDEALYTAITVALQYWLDKDPRNHNWWFNEISYPQQIGQILILMRSAPRPLPRDMEALLIQRMTRKLKPGDFANTSDEALHYLYRACLTKNKATLDSAVTFLFEPVRVQANGEGLQADNSYFQHGHQQAIASYGAVFIANSYNAAWYLGNTAYAMPAEQLRLLSSFFKNTFLQSLKGGYFDFSTRGRGISRVNSLRANILAELHKALLTDPTVADTRGTTHTCYWVSGYTLHTRQNYSLSVQLNSSRTLRTERGNNENILGKFLPDGATDIRRSGGEYDNIMPVWKWDKLPGVTNRAYGSDSGCTILKEWGIPGTTEFSGGISDSLYGATAYHLDYDSVKAHKSWFFFDREIVCLGAGIGSKAAEDITTTVNQCWLKGEVRTSADHPTAGAPRWVWHDSVGYFFPAGGNIEVSTGKQSGSWYRINHSGPKDEVSGKVFTLWIDHGVAPSDGNYAYVIVPGINSPAAMAAYDGKPIRIVQNTANLQAVEQQAPDILQVVFFSAGTLSDGPVTLTTDRPCMLLIRNAHGSHPEVYVADPTQKLAGLHLGLQLPGTGQERQLDCTLPQAPYAGSTIKLNIEK